MEALTLLIIFVTSWVLCYYIWDGMYRKRNLPPGPTPLPFIGNLLDLKTGRVVESLRELNQKFGDVYTIYLGPRRVVVLCGYDAVKEALVDRGNDFGSRGHLPVMDQYTLGHSVIFGNGECWKQLRRFSLMTLRNFGMGKRCIEERIQEEAQCLVEECKKTNGVPFNPTFHFSQVSSNIICSLIFGDRYGYDDPDFRRLMHIINEMFHSLASFWGQLFDIFDIVMRHVPGPHYKAVHCLHCLDEFVKEKMEEYLKTLNPDRPRHLIDSFLIKMEEEKDNPSTQFHMKNFFVNTTMLFVAGTETISTTLRFAFLLLLKYPDIRRKVQEEIDRVIGHQRAPQQEDRRSMPYTDAVIHEIQRYANVSPLNLPHSVNRDTEFHGFTIPKGTDVLPVLEFVLYDPKYFPDPEKFDPTRFLNEDGSFKRNEAFMVFSAGKRVCLGENLARLEIFIFVTTILQNFNITSPEDPKDLDISPQIGGTTNVPRTHVSDFGCSPKTTHDIILLLPISAQNGTMEALTLLLVFLVSCMVCYYTWERMYRRRNLPPGPTPLPLIGNLLQVKSGRLVETLKEMKQKYGDIYTLYLGPRRVVVLCGYDLVKEALVDRGDDFGIRGRLPVVELYTQGHGVIFSNGDCWKTMRRFTLSTFRSFGMGKRSIEERIQEEAQCLVEEFKKTNGVPFDPTYYCSQVSANIICSLIFGNRFDYDDAEFCRLISIINEIFRSMTSFWGQLFEVFEAVMKYLPGPHHKARYCAYKLEEFIKERMKKDLDTLNPDKPRHLIDSFLLKMEEEKHNTSTQFNMKNLLINTNSLFNAGTETISTTLRHGFLLLLKYPDIKCRVQEEIDRVIGRQRAPEPEDRISMPYTDAVIHEIQRYANVLPMNLPHAVHKDTQFHGFTIPKGTDVFPVLEFVLRDPKYFPDPYNFDPSRFLGVNGEFKKNEAFMVFSVGKRVCLGENLARLEIFIFLTTLLQNFDIKSHLEPKDLDISPQMVGFSNVPPLFKISFISR
ncbi:uncharacterized protein O3C94_016057 [Discoglossus pictus]